MAQGDAPPGLLSKVAKFVTNPTKDWSEIGQKEPEQDGGYSKEALKEMIERKRQNDFVRKREFDHLRKLRRREPSALPGQGGRPSFFQSSLTSTHDERAETLKKIDEIEAQMSHQWWKGKQEDGAIRPGPRVTPPAFPAEIDPMSTSNVLEDSNFVRTEASALHPSTHWPESPAKHPPADQPEAAITVPAEILPAAASMAGFRTNSHPLPFQSQASRGPVGAGFSTNRLFAVELADSLTDPDLEEAAIRFANGDDAGAEEGLLAALQGDNPQPASVEAWMSALFDLYRATGQQARFDQVALEFASRFGRSAPAWFSTPELLERVSAAASNAANAARGAADAPAWSCPAHLTLQSVAQLQTLMHRSDRSPLLLDWQSLAVIEPEALTGMGELFAELCSDTQQLVFRGYESLERVLRQVTPSGDRSSRPENWQLRLNALRVMRLQDEFELVALEYCVTFEVSPPSWQEVSCNCELEGANMGLSGNQGLLENGPRSGWSEPGAAMTVPMGLDGELPAMVELSGEVVGDAAQTLVRLEAGMKGATRVVISCARLIRVDFSAAGSILNWVAIQQSKGCQVQFRDVNRIVAAFFNVIGINEHARVVPRNA